MESGSTKLPPLKPRVPPVICVELLVAVGVVVLMAGETPTEMLKEFYEHILGLNYIDADDSTIRFRHQRRPVILDRKHSTPGRLGLAIRGFDEALLRLHERRITCEILHDVEIGSRTAITRDPAGNFVHLLEVRPF